MTKISIIVPIYNSEKYLNRCIDSIINQSFKNFELLLLNDGSTDSSLNIIKKYEIKDSRVKVIDQRNMGVAKTRNKAIKLCSGEYVMFVDNDDFLDIDYLETFFNEIDKSKMDVIIGGYKRVNTKNDIIELANVTKGDFGKYMIITPWAKIYRCEFLISKKIEFLDYPIGEDIYFYFQILSNTDKIKSINYAGYNWYYNEKSISNVIHKGFRENIDITYLLNKLNKKVKNQIYYNEEEYNYFFVRFIIWYLLYSGKTATVESFMLEYNKLFVYLKKEISQYHKYIFKSIKGDNFKNKLAIKMFLLLDKTKLVKLFAIVYCRGKKI